MSTHTHPRTIVITGASSGIGQACAEVFARNGWRLVLGARRVERLREMAPKLEKLGASGVSCLPLDVRDGKQVIAFADAAQAAAQGRVDVLLNNAGLAAGLATVSEGLDDDWRAMLDTNVYGLLDVTRRFLPAMISADAGHIINMGSIAGFQTYAYGAVYAATKHAVRAISGALRLELNGTRIRVSEIDPGMVETEFALVRLGDADKAKRVYDGMQPLTAEDIAECTYFCASRPAHVNIDNLVVMPTDQASVYKVHRREP